MVLHDLTHGLAHQDLSGPSLGAEPVGYIHRISDYRVLQPAVASDVAGEHVPMVDADADSDLGAAGADPALV
jgi:hypothetical protein